MTTGPSSGVSKALPVSHLLPGPRGQPLRRPARLLRVPSSPSRSPLSLSTTAFTDEASAEALLLPPLYLLDGLFRTSSCSYSLSVPPAPHVCSVVNE